MIPFYTFFCSVCMVPIKCATEVTLKCFEFSLGVKYTGSGQRGNQIAENSVSVFLRDCLYNDGGMFQGPNVKQGNKVSINRVTMQDGESAYIDVDDEQCTPSSPADRSKSC